MTDNLIKNAESKPFNPKAAMAKQLHSSVASSPFNGLKLELAIILVVFILVSVVLSTLASDSGEMFLSIFCVSLVASLWMGFRTWQLLRKLKHAAKEE